MNSNSGLATKILKKKLENLETYCDCDACQLEEKQMIRRALEMKLQGLSDKERKSNLDEMLAMHKLEDQLLNAEQEAELEYYYSDSEDDYIPTWH